MPRLKPQEITIEEVHKYYLDTPRKSLNEYELIGLIFWYLDKYESFNQTDFIDYINLSMPYYTTSPTAVCRVCKFLIAKNLTAIDEKRDGEIGSPKKKYIRTIFGKKVTREIVNFWENYRDRLEYRTES